MYSNSSSVKTSISYVNAQEQTAQGDISLTGHHELFASVAYRRVLKNNSVINIYSKFVQRPKGFKNIDHWNRTDISWLIPKFFGADVTLKVANLFNDRMEVHDVSSDVEKINDYGRHFSLSIKSVF